MNLKDTLQIIGKEIQDRARRNLLKKTPHGRKRIMRNSVASGKLYNSIKYKIIGKGEDLELDFEFKEYGYWIDQGRDPGPISAQGTRSLKKWMDIKGIDSKYLYVIKRSIEANGFRETLFFTKAQNEVLEDSDKIIEDYMSDMVDRFFEEL